MFITQTARYENARGYKPVTTVGVKTLPLDKPVAVHFWFSGSRPYILDSAFTYET